MYRNSYEDYPLVISDLTYNDLSRSHDFRLAISQKQCMIRTKLLLLMYRNSYEDYPLVISDLTYGDLSRSDQGHMTLDWLYLRNGA